MHEGIFHPFSSKNLMISVALPGNIKLFIVLTSSQVADHKQFFYWLQTIILSRVLQDDQMVQSKIVGRFDRRVNKNKCCQLLKQINTISCFNMKSKKNTAVTKISFIVFRLKLGEKKTEIDRAGYLEIDKYNCLENLFRGRRNKSFLQQFTTKKKTI